MRGGTGYDPVSLALISRTWILSGVALPALLGALHWGQNRWTLPSAYLVQVVAIWGLTYCTVAPGLISLSLAQPAFPYGGTDYIAVSQRFQTIRATSNVLALSALAVLITLPILSLLLGRKRTE